MKVLHRLLFALLLTPPFYAGVTAMPWLSRWFNSGAGWDAVVPILRMLGSRGGEQNDDYLFGTLLAISFMLAVLVVGLASRLARRARDRGT